MWSEDGPCYIIGEAGSNHDGDLDQAKQLIGVAYGAQCDAVKFQCIPPFKREWVPELKGIAGDCGLDFLATPFDVEAVRFLSEMDVSLLKIASPEIVNLPLIRAAGRTRKPLILSTGMATLSDVETALEAARLAAYMDGFPRIALLQCTTRYPAPAHQANLYAMDTLRDAFGVPVGLSDHTEGIAVPIAAAALRASIVEKHFTLDRNLEGPDHSYALEPVELKAMVEGIREAEQALGDGRKSGPSEGELIEARGRQLTWE